MIIINDADPFIHDFKKYRYLFHELTGRYLRYPEYYSTLTFLSRPRIKPPQIDWCDFKALNDLFVAAHPYLDGHYIIHTLIQADWAYHIGLITADELDAMRKRWRSTC